MKYFKMNPGEINLYLGNMKSNKSLEAIILGQRAKFSGKIPLYLKNKTHTREEEITSRIGRDINGNGGITQEAYLIENSEGLLKHLRDYEIKYENKEIVLIIDEIQFFDLNYGEIEFSETLHTLKSGQNEFKKRYSINLFGLNTTVESTPWNINTYLMPIATSIQKLKNPICEFSDDCSHTADYPARKINDIWDKPGGSIVKIESDEIEKKIDYFVLCTEHYFEAYPDFFK